MAMPLKVAVYKGDELLSEETFDRDIIKIGRLASAHLRLDDTKVSRIHAVIEVASDGDGFSIIDMGSSDGTFVNGERISKEKVRDGDEITVGDCRLVVSIGGTEDVAEGDVAAAAAIPPAAPVPSEAPAPVEQPWSPETAPDYQQLPATQVAVAAMPGAYNTGSAAPQMPLGQPVSQVPVGMPVSQAPVSQAPGGQMMAGQPGMQQPVGWSQPPGWDPNMQQQPGWDPNLAQQQQQWAQGVWQQHQQQMQQQQAWGSWGSVPNNLAASNVPETDRALEIKAIWADSVLDTVTAYDQEVITMGDEPKVTGFGPWKHFQKADIDAPSRGLGARTYPIAESMSSTGATYQINISNTFTGHVERADGSFQTLEELVQSGRNMTGSSVANARGYNLQPEETLYLHHGNLTLQIRYVRRTKFLAPPWTESLNYTWVNVLILTFFLHVLAVSVLVATPHTTEDLAEALFKNPNRFAQYRLTPEQKKKQDSLLSKLKAGEVAAKAKGNEGKAGRKNYKKKDKGRMAVKGKPDDKEIAKSAITKLLGAGTKGGRSYLFGSGGLGGELKAAMGGVTGAQVGDAAGLGGLGTRGQGPGGGGLSMNSVGLGALGTAGRGGGGDGSYGSGVGRLGKKVERDINITPGNPVIMGSLDKELIRRVINQHKAQIRYCYEKELVRSPGLFGKIGMVWTIKADGRVRDAKVKQSTMKSPGVENCIASKIRTWKFPKPKGGGIVIVNYPFVFKTSG